MRTEIILNEGKLKYELKINKSVTLEALAAGYQPECPYRILLARVNGVDRELSEAIGISEDTEDTMTIEFLDMRTHSADLVYQRGISILYLKAVRDVLGADAAIDNTLNKGFYTKPKLDHELTEKEVKAVEIRMREMVDADMPLTKEHLSMEEGIQAWKDAGYDGKAELLAEARDTHYRPVFYTLDGYRNYFFGPMVPSMGYINFFELRKYGKGLLVRFPYYTKPDEIPEYIDDRKIYDTFGEAHDWLKLLKVESLPELNSKIDEGDIKDLILLSEALHEKKIAEIADMISEEKKRIVLIAGPSSSGKTTFTRRLCIQLRVNGLQPLYLGTDDYFVEREDSPRDEDGNYNFEDLEALDIDLFNRNMNDLLSGREADIPEFDFIEGKKIFGKRVQSISADQPVVIEGIHALNRRLTADIDDKEIFRIYISPFTQMNIDIHNRVASTDARMLRRMVRDNKYRGHSAAETIKEWPKVRAGENRNIFPYNVEADVLFNSNLVYETSLLKRYVEPMLLEIKRDQPEYSEAVRLLEFLNFFRTIETDNYVPNNSIMREFTGGSVFTEE